MSVSKEQIKKKGTVRQHFVPQFYLRNFGSKIYCFDKKNETKFLTNSDNVAVKADFYGGEYEGISSLETIFSQLENRHANAIRNLIEKQDYYQLSYDSKLAICEFLGFQYLRTEHSRKNITHLTESLYNLCASKIIPEHLKLKITEDGSIGMHLSILKDYQKFAALFFKMKFVLFLNKTPIPFWTSDHPISKQNEYDENPYGNLGIVNRGIEIHLPITPTMCLCALDPTIFGIIPNIMNIFKKQSVIRENFLQLKYSTRFVYSNIERFHCIRAMLQNNPDYKDDLKTDSDIFVKHSKNATCVITSERNDRWPIKDDGKIMDKMDTWIDTESVDKIFKNTELDS